LTEAVVRQYATPESFRRGQDYYRRGMVLSVVRRGGRLAAEVGGSQYKPYRVRITLTEWQVYLEDLIARHHRKYSLVPMLEGLR